MKIKRKLTVIATAIIIAFSLPSFEDLTDNEIIKNNKPEQT